MNDDFDHNATPRGSFFQLQESGKKEQGSMSTTKGLKAPTILVVDDEELVLELVCDIFKRQGYIVLAALRPSKAIEMATEYEGDIDLLITDIIMPTMNGQELANKISYIRPTTKILLMSGHTGDIIFEQAQFNENMQFIEKPFLGSVLRKKVQKMIFNN